MSGLPYQEIKKRCEKYKLIDPYHEKTVFDGKSFGNSESGYDLRIRETITVYPVTLTNLAINALYKIYHTLTFSKSRYKEPRPSFVLASTLETFNIQNDIRAEIKDKSSWIREGLSVHNTVCEPGWHGTLTLELKNVGSNVIKLKSGHPIAQVLFTKLTAATIKSYKGKYQNQPARPVESIKEKE